MLKILFDFDYFITLLRTEEVKNVTVLFLYYYIIIFHYKF